VWNKIYYSNENKNWEDEWWILFNQSVYSAGLPIAFSTDSFDYFLNNNNFITQQGTLLEKYVFISASHHSRKRMISVDINLYLFLNTWGYWKLNFIKGQCTVVKLEPSLLKTLPKQNHPKPYFPLERIFTELYSLQKI
jgi:hypothetical protein